jgi:ubiquinone/menaquinone biosynthesis C-methylase UbiE
MTGASPRTDRIRADTGTLTPSEFEAAYRGTPPWEIGRPQAAFAATAEAWRGRVLDAGCGTGELALAAAARGLAATGIDGAVGAIRTARQRCAQRGLSADFVVGDVLRLPEFVDGRFDTVFDSGLFHVFDGDDRPTYVAALAAVTGPGSRLLLLAFSDAEPGEWGPRRVGRDELVAAFADGWHVEHIEPAVFALADVPNARPPAAAWFADIRRR